MDIQLKTKGQVEVYDVITTFAVSAPAVGLQRICRHAQLNENFIDANAIENQFKLSPGASRNLFINGIQSGVWDEGGILTEEGHQTALTGDVLVKEVGPLRIWSYENDVTGPVLFHAARPKNLPYADARPQADHAPEILRNISDGISRQGLLKQSGDPRWQINWTDRGSSWAIIEKFCTPAELVWKWGLYEGTWTVDDELNLKCKLIGTSNNKEKDGVVVTNNYQQTGALDPETCIRDWLSSGRFTKGAWNVELQGLKRPFSELNVSEKLQYTTNEVLKSEADGWDEVIINSIPLLARTQEDAADWASFVLENQTPAYTTTERTERVLNDILEDNPFKSINTGKVYERTMNQIASNRSNNPRLSKYLHAGDDLDAVAFVPTQVERMKRDEYTAVLEPGEGYDEFILQLTNNLKGEIKNIWYVDKYASLTDQRKRLSKIVKSFRETLGGFKFGLLTAYDPYSTGKRDRTEYLRKMEEISDIVHFMEDYKIAPHNRYIVIQTNKETRWWNLPDGLVSGMSRVKSATKLEPGRGIEESVSNFINSNKKSNEKGKSK
mgnify:FL=1|tara:strand:+ start:5668 stop:7326 length:1659 start_codon:yes stop_codon:yes gene_type:complete